MNNQDSAALKKKEKIAEKRENIKRIPEIGLGAYRKSMVLPEELWSGEGLVGIFYFLETNVKKPDGGYCRIQFGDCLVVVWWLFGGCLGTGGEVIGWGNDIVGNVLKSFCRFQNSTVAFRGVAWRGVSNIPLLHTFLSHLSCNTCPTPPPG